VADSTATLYVTGLNSAVFLFDANEGPYLIVNGDPQNTIYLGDSSSIGLTDPDDTIPLVPGASIGYTSDHPNPVWVNGTPGVVSPVYIIPGASGYFRPISDLILQGLNPGLFIYRPSVGFNNLVGAWTALSGEDQYGNAYGAGITVNQGSIQGAGFTYGAIISAYLGGSNINSPNIGGPSVAGGDFLGANIVQTEQGGVILNYGAGLVTQILTATQGWTCPNEVTAARVECTAGSGGGSADGTTGGGNGGGGPGWSCEPNYVLVPGKTYQAIIGVAGQGANATGNGGDGGITSFDNTIIAYPGKGGTLSAGGLGGPVSINTLSNAGGAGGDGSISGGGGGGGGSATSAGPGTAGSNANSSAGAIGGSPGGGTGGGSGNPGSVGSTGGGGGSGSGSPGSQFIFYPVATYSYYGSDAVQNAANGIRATNGLLYSGEDVLGTYNGNQYSFSYFGTALAAELTGYNIVSCHLICTVDYVVNGALNGILVLGYAPFTSFPSSGMSLTGSSPNVAQASVTAETVTSIDISQTAIPVAFQTGAATCLLFGPGPSTSDMYFAELAGGAGPNAGPYLVFNVH
jgi:hypothetical protein